MRAKLGCSALILTAAVFAGPRDSILWRDPGRVETLDFRIGPGGRSHVPAPPYRFIEEDHSGSYPKVKVRDARGHVWAVKFGREVRSEPFAARIAWAAGYFVEPIYFVAAGRIEGVHGLKRAAASIAPDGSFRDARFQARDKSVQFMNDHNWSWTYNPFYGTRELNGLKIVLLLTSNWDNKDARDEDDGINTAIFQRRSAPRYIYAFTDWGGTMGHWGNYVRRSVWNCEHFAQDTPEFVSVKDGRLKWGYHGRHNSDFLDDIRPADVAWILRYIGRIRDYQFEEGLKASGASPAEAECFRRELRRRIIMLHEVTSGLR